MNQCKNCNKEISEKRKYCSLKCRNIFVNLHIRDYTKLRQHGSIIKQQNILVYEKNPKYCLQCHSMISYEQRSNIFCNSICSATYSHTHKEYRISSKTKDKISVGVKKYYKEHPELHRAAYSCGGTIEKYKVAYELYKVSPNKCTNCNFPLIWKHRNRKYCTKTCRVEYERKNLSEFKKYQLDCKFKFNLNTYPKEFDFSLIETYGWYKAKNRGDNLTGISRDHMYSIKDGFLHNVDLKIISHPANCRLIKQTDNSSKWKKSCITLDELKERIKIFNEKYNEDTVQLD